MAACPRPEQPPQITNEARLVQQSVAGEQAKQVTNTATLHSRCHVADSFFDATFGWDGEVLLALQM
ncbi:hypothetical protein ABH37_17180 [Mycobacterium haemophilum]|uniref:Uncharacterized protein n=1 Tax=Mycobacterium haemophilum TaxID=29311 RepID=A0A0I9UZ72_9MYCO|nr:hypothetical protein ABH39_16055 [Mycobacterium haemophilum]KLO35050.1 hypothetical protein ABH38_17070 [Mycobacterium haemophilum]KLO39995.1 hypothetical protein ABH37_17180 [Mycobacterium haemophilum]KLO47325.1 hypothetical protein ABH36_17000 [Mycobacterium haemophilum]